MKKLLEDWVFQGEVKRAEAEIRNLLQQAESLYSKDTYFDYLDVLALLKQAQQIFDAIPLYVEITTLKRSNPVMFSSDGKYLVCGSGIYRTDNFQKIKTLAGSQSTTYAESATFYIDSVAFSPDGKYLACGSYDKVGVYQTDDFQEIKILKVAHNNDLSISFSPDGKYLASGSGKRAGVYRTDGFQRIATLTGHSYDVTSISFSPDGKYLASVDGITNTIKIWCKGVISRQEFEAQERRSLEAEKEAERRRKEQELREYQLENKLCLECGAKLSFLDKLSGAQYCKQHKK